MTDVRGFTIWSVHRFTSAPHPAPSDGVLAELLRIVDPDVDQPSHANDTPKFDNGGVIGQNEPR